MENQDILEAFDAATKDAIETTEELKRMRENIHQYAMIDKFDTNALEDLAEEYEALVQEIKQLVSMLREFTY